MAQEQTELAVVELVLNNTNKELNNKKFDDNQPLIVSAVDPSQLQINDESISSFPYKEFKKHAKICGYCSGYRFAILCIIIFIITAIYNLNASYIMASRTKWCYEDETYKLNNPLYLTVNVECAAFSNVSKHLYIDSFLLIKFSIIAITGFICLNHNIMLLMFLYLLTRSVYNILFIYNYFDFAQIGAIINIFISIVSTFVFGENYFTMKNVNVLWTEILNESNRKNVNNKIEAYYDYGCCCSCLLCCVCPVYNVCSYCAVISAAVSKRYYGKRNYAKYTTFKSVTNWGIAVALTVGIIWFIIECCFWFVHMHDHPPWGGKYFPHFLGFVGDLFTNGHFWDRLCQSDNDYHL